MGCQGLFTPVSLWYPLSVFNKKFYSQRFHTSHSTCTHVTVWHTSNNSGKSHVHSTTEKLLRTHSSVIPGQIPSTKLRTNQRIIHSVHHRTRLESIVTSRMRITENEEPYRSWLVQNIWMFTNWYSEPNLCYFGYFSADEWRHCAQQLRRVAILTRPRPRSPDSIMTTARIWARRRRKRSVSASAKSSKAPHPQWRHTSRVPNPRKSQILPATKSHTYIYTYILYGCEVQIPYEVPVIESYFNLQKKSRTERRKESNTKNMREKTQPNHSAENCFFLSLSLSLSTK